MTATVLAFDELRSDWYAANDIVPRYLLKACAGIRIRFDGFPRQWLPLFAWCGATWKNSRRPSRHIPIISDLNTRALELFIRTASTNDTLRELVEAVACLDPLIADALYIVDNRTPIPDCEPAREAIPLTGWASYGRPEVRAFERRVAKVPAGSSTTVAFLPCSRKRPYDQSRTYKRVCSRLAKAGVDPSLGNVDEVVITSLGVVPRSLWSDPVVLAYDAGAPDIYRLLRLTRNFLACRTYRRVIDCLQFEPYSDLLRIAQREGLFDELVVIPKARIRRFHVSTEL